MGIKWLSIDLCGLYDLTLLDGRTVAIYQSLWLEWLNPRGWASSDYLSIFVTYMTNLLGGHQVAIYLSLWLVWQPSWMGIKWLSIDLCDLYNNPFGWVSRSYLLIFVTYMTTLLDGRQVAIYRSLWLVWQPFWMGVKWLSINLCDLVSITVCGCSKWILCFSDAWLT